MFTHELGFDLGTSIMHIGHREKGVILSEPAVIITDKKGKLLAVGAEAHEMVDKTPPDMYAKTPVKYGVVADFDPMSSMLKEQLKKLKVNKRFSGNRAVVSVPNDISEVERKATYDLFVQLGFSTRRVHLIEKPVAAAIGAGIEILEPYGNMIVDIGGGSTEISVVSLGGIVISKLLKIGGDKFDEDIIAVVKKKYGIYIGKKSAERIKHDIGSALVDEELTSTQVVGRDMVTGLPKTVTVTNEDVCKALQEDMNIIVDAIRYILEKTPPELSSDILETGIYLCGGSAQLRNLGDLISAETSLKVNVVDAPMACVVNGINTVLRKMKKYESVLNASS